MLNNPVVLEVLKKTEGNIINLKEIEKYIQRIDSHSDYSIVDIAYMKFIIENEEYKRDMEITDEINLCKYRLEITRTEFCKTKRIKNFFEMFLDGESFDLLYSDDYSDEVEFLFESLAGRVNLQDMFDILTQFIKPEFMEINFFRNHIVAFTNDSNKMKELTNIYQANISQRDLKGNVEKMSWAECNPKRNSIVLTDMYENGDCDDYYNSLF